MFIALLFTLLIHAEQLKVAVLDTGFDLYKINDIKLCENGLQDFSNSGTVHDTHVKNHGTNIVGIINKYSKNPDVCFYILKVFDDKATVVSTANAIIFAIAHNVHIINYSGGGIDYSKYESEAIKIFLDRKGIFIAAGGNNHSNLDLKCNYYPACSDPRVTVITNTKIYSNKLKRSIKISYDGSNDFIYGEPIWGTSQSTALATASLLNALIGKHPWSQ